MIKEEKYTYSYWILLKKSKNREDFFVFENEEMVGFLGHEGRNFFGFSTDMENICINAKIPFL